MFKENDTILYGTHGACAIASISERNLSGTPKKYYVLKPLRDESATLYVPYDNEKLTAKMRNILSAEEIRALIRTMPEETSVWIDNDNERKKIYKDIIARGDRLELISIIKALYLHQQKQQDAGRKFHVADEIFLKDAERLLYQEFALVLNLKPHQVLPFIMAELDAAVE